MNKYDELIERAKRFTDTAIVGELINAVGELKKRPDVVRCKDCKNFVHLIGRGERSSWGCRFMGRNIEENAFCSYEERKEK